MTRRTFYERATFALGSLIALGLAVPSAIYLLLGGRRKQSGDWTDAGKLSSLRSGEPTLVSVQLAHQDAWKQSVEELTVWAVKKSDSEVVVYSPHCTHLGCGYRWIDEHQQFQCPCHDSAFDKDGSVLHGPAPRPLDRFQTRIEEGRIWLGPVRTDV